VADDSGMTCHGIRPNVRHIGILHLVLSLTLSPQSTSHSAPVCKILSKSDHTQQEKMMSCRFSSWWISAILDFRGPIMDSLKSPCTTSCRLSIDTIAHNCFVFRKIAFWHQDPRWRISSILGFRGPIVGSLKSLYMTSYRSSIDTIALICLVFEKISFLQFGDRQTDRQINEQMDRPDA